MTHRIAVTGTDPAATAAASALIAHLTSLPVISCPVVQPRAGALARNEFSHIHTALTDFAQRTDREAPATGFVSDGSVLRFWAWLHNRYTTTSARRLIRRARHVPELVFLRGFVRAHRGIVIRHAAASYTTVILLTGPPTPGRTPDPVNTALLQAISETGLPIHLIPDEAHIPALIASISVSPATT